MLRVAQELIERSEVRSRHTIDAIFEATVRVLLANEFDKTTTIQIVKEESSRCAQAVHDMLITASDASTQCGLCQKARHLE